MDDSLIAVVLAEAPSEAGQLALALHMAGNADLAIPVPDDWSPMEVIDSRFRVDQLSMTFSSLVARNQVLAEYLYARVRAAGPTDFQALFVTAKNLWVKERPSQDFASGRLLLEASRHTDVLAQAAQQIRCGANAFQVFRVVDAYLSHVDDLNIPSLFDLARAEGEVSKGGVVMGALYSIVENWLAARPSVARRLYSSAVANIDGIAANFVSVALLGIVREYPDEAVDLTIDLLTSEVDLLKRAARWMCGQLLLRDNICAARRSKIEQIVLSGTRDPDPVSQRDAFVAATGAMHLSDVFDDELLECGRRAEGGVLTLISHALFMKSDDLLAQDRFYKWLPLLVALSPVEHDALEVMDDTLAKLLNASNGRQAEVVAFLNAWILQHTGSRSIEKTFADEFHQCVYQLAAQEQCFATVLTNWLAHEAREFPSAAAGVLNKLRVSGFDGVRLDPLLLNAMSPSELHFLGGRILGFVLDTENLLSISLSFLEMDDERLEKSIPLLGSLIVGDIGYDYPGTTIEALIRAEQREARPFALSALRAWRSAIEASQEILKALPRRNELRPPSRLQRDFALARSKQMDRARKEASSDSIVSKIATVIPLKAGIASFNHMRGQYSEPSMLHTMSHSIEIPRREVMDPVGYAIRGFELRTAKKNSS